MLDSDGFEHSLGRQLDHRILATTTLLSVTGMWAATRKLPLDPRVRTLLNATFGMAALQVAPLIVFFIKSLKGLKF